MKDALFILARVLRVVPRAPTAQTVGRRVRALRVVLPCGRGQRPGLSEQAVGRKVDALLPPHAASLRATSRAHAMWWVKPALHRGQRSTRALLTRDWSGIDEVRPMWRAWTRTTTSSRRTSTMATSTASSPFLSLLPSAPPSSAPHLPALPLILHHPPRLSRRLHPPQPQPRASGGSRSKLPLPPLQRRMGH